MLVEQDGSVAVRGSRRRIETKTDGVVFVKTWPDGERCAFFDPERRTFWECSEGAPPASAGPRPEISRLSVREIAVPADAQAARAGLKSRGRILSCRLTSPIPGGAQNLASRFMTAYVEDLDVEVVVWEADAPGLVVPWRLHANLFGQRLPAIEDALVTFLSSGDGRPARLHMRTTRKAERGVAVSDEMDVVFGEFRAPPADPSFFEVPPGYRHEKPAVGVPVR